MVSEPRKLALFLSDPVHRWSSKGWSKVALDVVKVGVYVRHLSPARLRVHAGLHISYAGLPFFKILGGFAGYRSRSIAGFKHLLRVEFGIFYITRKV